MNQHNSNEKFKKELIKIAVIIPALTWTLFFVIFRSFYGICSKFNDHVDNYMTKLLTEEDE